MDAISYLLLFLACIAGVGIDVALPYIAKLNKWKKMVEEADDAGQPEPDFDLFWKHGKRFNKVYLIIGAINFIFSVGIVFGLLMATQRAQFGDALDVMGAFWWAYGQNRLVNNLLSGKITSAEELRR